MKHGQDKKAKKGWADWWKGATEVVDNEERRILLSPHAWRKMITYAQAAGPSEVSGLGRVRVTEQRVTDTVFEKCHPSEAVYTPKATGSNVSYWKPVETTRTVHTYHIDDVFIMPQRCNAGYTRLDDDALTVFLTNLAKRGMDPKQYNLWWHSHGNGGTFWSGTDDSNCIRLSKKHELVSIVVNTHGEMLARWDHAGSVADDIPIALAIPADPAFEKRCRAEVSENVKPLTLTPENTEFWSYEDYNRKHQMEPTGHHFLKSGVQKAQEIDGGNFCKENGHWYGGGDTCLDCGAKKPKVESGAVIITAIQKNAHEEAGAKTLYCTLHKKMVCRNGDELCIACCQGDIKKPMGEKCEWTT